MQDIQTISALGLHADSRVLFVLPHPDDEAVFASGLIAACTHRRIELKTITCTRGEKSTLRYGLTKSADLAAARDEELRTALRILKVAKHEIWHFPDGGLESSFVELKRKITIAILDYQPTDVFCLEPDGIYGHPDHIALTQAVTASIQKPVQLWFVTVAPWYQSSSARHMAKKSTIKPVLAEYRLVLSWWQIWLKFLALCAHKSQFKLLPWQGTTFQHFLDNGIWTSEFFSRGN